MGFSKENRRKKIRLGIRKKIKGTPTKPRLAVFKSNKVTYCQLIDDVNGLTIASASTNHLDLSGSKSEQAKAVGKMIAEKALSVNINEVKFDRSGYQYHGRVKSLAEGAREAGLNF